MPRKTVGALAALWGSCTFGHPSLSTTGLLWLAVGLTVTLQAYGVQPFYALMCSGPVWVMWVYYTIPLSVLMHNLAFFAGDGAAPPSFCSACLSSRSSVLFSRRRLPRRTQPAFCPPSALCS